MAPTNISKGSTTTTAMGSQYSSIRASVIIPFLSREKHLLQAIDSWQSNDFKRKEILVVDFSGKSTNLDLGKVKLVRSQSTRWNISRARNLGARKSIGDLLIFATADHLVPVDFISAIASTWAQAELWVNDSLVRDLPHDPSMDGLIAVKRWANTRLRGFNEPMMETPHAWGHDVADYILRCRSMITSCGGTYLGYQPEAVSVLTHSDDARVAPYEVKDLEAGMVAHEQFAERYRAACGFVANVGATWGDDY